MSHLAVDHKVTLSTADDASLLVQCSCGQYLVDTLRPVDLGELLTLVERHLQERDVVTVLGRSVTSPKENR